MNDDCPIDLYFDQLKTTIWIGNFAWSLFSWDAFISMFNVQPLFIIGVYVWALGT